MMNLAEYRRRAQGLADFLPWAALVERGVILSKDGSFQPTPAFAGLILTPRRRPSSWPSHRASTMRCGGWD